MGRINIAGYCEYPALLGKLVGYFDFTVFPFVVFHVLMQDFFNKAVHRSAVFIRQCFEFSIKGWI